MVGGEFLMLKIIGIIVVGVIGVIGAFLFMSGSFSSDPNNILNTGEYLTITVEGEVEKPGTYALDLGATMNDLIEKAGGATDNADPLAYFDDAMLSEGMTYYIAPKYDLTDICATEPIKKVNVNTDSQEKIQEIDGVSSSVASSIVSYRAGGNRIDTLEELLEVYGIGNATYTKMRNYVILHA